VRRRPALGATRLFLDRAFTLRGIGTVATGTLWAGSIGEGDELLVEPRGRSVRVRSVHVHDEPVERAAAGQRVAVSLPGVERHELRRGDALVAPGHYPVSYRLDVALDELAPIPSGARVKVHHGTAERLARLVRAEPPFAQLRLAGPVVAARGDRVVLRDATTLGGARVLDPAPPRRLDAGRLAPLAGEDPAAIVAAIVREPTRRETLAARGLLAPADLERGLAAVERAGPWHFSSAWLDELRGRTRARLAARAAASPLDPGLPLAELLPEPWAGEVLPLLGLERRGATVYLPGAAASLGDRTEAAARIEAELAEAGGNAVKVADRELARSLEGAGRIVRVGDGKAVAADAYARARAAVEDECASAGRITIARLRDLLGVGRQTAQLLLERCDADGLTRRVGDERVLRRSAARR
jgi:selenocysteine-specific elongation factor